MKLQMRSALYSQTVLMKGMSAIAGEQKHWRELPAVELPEMPIIQAFLDDEDLQEITIVSTNIGFVRTFQKIPLGAKWRGKVYAE